jgi:TolB-like protein/DNA-binding winged helix-turn-helix (wHTH) protein
LSTAAQADLVRGFRLGPWLVEPNLNRVSANGRETRLEGKVMGVLVALASRPGELVTKEELLDQVWSDVVVIEGVVKRCIAELRDALEDDAHQPTFIETIARKGYRLLAPVEPMQAAAPVADLRAAAVSPPASAARTHPRTGWVLIGLGAVAAIIVALGAWWQLGRSPGDEAPVATPAKASSVAVLPFEYFSADASRAWLAPGLSEEVIHSLANVRGLRVAARTSSFAFGARTATVPEIGRQLNVDAVLEGSIRVEGEDIRVTAQLINAGTGLHVWSRVFERDLEDLFAVQDEIARHVAESLRGVITDTGEASYVSRPPPTRSFEAYALYLNALSLWRERGTEAHRRAVDLLRAAIGLDPSFGRAHSLLANAYHTMVFYAGMPYEEMAPLARASADQARRLDPNDSYALTVLGALARTDLDWSNATSLLAAAVAADPSNSTARQRYAEMLFSQGYLRRGVAEIEAAMRIDPLAASVRSVGALGAIYAGDPDGALARAAETRALGSPRAGQLESWVRVERGEFDKARDARLESATSMQRWSEHIEPVYAALADRARLPEALAALAAAPEAVARTEGFFYYELAILGETEAALAALARLEGTTDTTMLVWLSELAPMRQAPGFGAAMQRTGLVDYWLANGMPDLCEQRSGQVVCR